MHKRWKVSWTVVLILTAVGAVRAIADGRYAPFIPIALVLAVAWTAHFLLMRRSGALRFGRPKTRSSKPFAPRRDDKVASRSASGAKTARKSYPFRVIEGGKRDR